MQPKHRAAFERLFDRYDDWAAFGRAPAPPLEQDPDLARPMLLRTQDRIASVPALRADARLFLLSNLVQMVVWPVLIAEGPAALGRLREAIDMDLRTLQEVTANREDASVSAEEVIEISRQPNLSFHVLELRIWGPSSDQERRER